METLGETCKNGDIDKVRESLENGANPNEQGKRKWTPLHFSSQRGDREITKLLLEKGASPTAAAIDGRTPLHVAAIEGHEGIAEDLLEAGCDINAQDKQKQIPLHKAALNGHLEVVEVLIERGSNVNAETNGGQTPLHSAAEWGHKDVITKLMSGGADVLLKDKEGKQPLERAREGGFDEIVQILERAERLLRAEVEEDTVDEVKRSLSDAGGVITTKGGAQVYIPREAIDSDSSPHDSSIQVVHLNPTLSHDVVNGLDKGEGSPPSDLMGERVCASAMIRFDSQPALKQHAVVRLPHSSTLSEEDEDGENSLQVWGEDNGKWVGLDPSQYTIGDNLVQVRLSKLPRHLTTFYAKPDKVKEHTIALAFLSSKGDSEEELPTRLVVHVLANRSDLRNDIIERMGNSLPTPCSLFAETLDTLTLSSGDEVTVEVPGERALVRRYALRPLSFEYTLSAESVAALPTQGLPITVGLANGDSVQLLVQRMDKNSQKRSSDDDRVVTYTERCRKAAKAAKLYTRCCQTLAKRSATLTFTLDNMPREEAPSSMDPQSAYNESLIRSAVTRTIGLLDACAAVGWLAKVLLRPNPSWVQSFYHTDGEMVEAADSNDLNMPRFPRSNGGVQYLDDFDDDRYMLPREQLVDHLLAQNGNLDKIKDLAEELACDFQTPTDEFLVEINTKDFHHAVDWLCRTEASAQGRKRLSLPPIATGSSKDAIQMLRHTPRDDDDDSLSGSSLSSARSPIDENVLDDPTLVYLSGVIREVGRVKHDGPNKHDINFMESMSKALTSMGATITTSEHSLKSGRKRLQALERTVTRCRAFVILISPLYGDAGLARYSQREFETARRMNKPVFPLLCAEAVPAHLGFSIPPTSTLPLHTSKDFPAALAELYRSLKSLNIINPQKESASETDEDMEARVVNDALSSLGMQRLARSPSSMTSIQPTTDSQLTERSISSSSMALQQWLAQYNLSHVAPVLAELGAYSPEDLQDLEEEDLHGLALKPLELKRFCRARNEYFAAITTSRPTTAGSGVDSTGGHVTTISMSSPSSHGTSFFPLTPNNAGGNNNNNTYGFTPTIKQQQMSAAQQAMTAFPPISNKPKQAEDPKRAASVRFNDGSSETPSKGGSVTTGNVRFNTPSGGDDSPGRSSHHPLSHSVDGLPPSRALAAEDIRGGDQRRSSTPTKGIRGSLRKLLSIPSIQFPGRGRNSSTGNADEVTQQMRVASDGAIQMVGELSLHPSGSLKDDTKQDLSRRLTEHIPDMQRIDDFIIGMEDLELEERPFAVGGSGQIFRGTYNSADVAVKAMFSHMSEKERKDFHREFEMLAQLHHPNIVSFYGVSEDPSKGLYYMVEEYCVGGDLSHWMLGETFTPTECARIIKEINSGVIYMHDRDIAHRDLKPQNVLITSSGQAKIADLGQARSFSKTGSTVAIGTVSYMPPEAFDDATTDDPNYLASAWDIYALGVIMHELWYRKCPWGNYSTQKIFSRVSRGKRPAFNEPEPPLPFKQLIEAMWAQNSGDRPVIRDASRAFQTQIAPILKQMPDFPPGPPSESTG